MEPLRLEATQQALLHQIDPLGGRQLLVPEAEVLLFGFGFGDDRNRPNPAPAVANLAALDHADQAPRWVGRCQAVNLRPLSSVRNTSAVLGGAFCAWESRGRRPVTPPGSWGMGWRRSSIRAARWETGRRGSAARFSDRIRVVGARLAARARRIRPGGGRPGVSHLRNPLSER